MSSHPQALCILYLLLLLVLVHFVCATQPHDAPVARRSGTAASKPSLVVLSTLDGAVLGLDAASGREMFAVRADTPALSSWAREGYPEYVPTLDGALYELDPRTGEATQVDARFIMSAPRDEPPADTSALAGGTLDGASGAVVLTSQSTTALSVSLRSGKVVHALNYNTPVDAVLDDDLAAHVPGDDIVLLRRSQIGVRVVDPATQRELANATLTHTHPSFLEKGRCLVPGGPDTNAIYTAAISKDRATITLRDASGAEVWKRSVDSAVVDMHGMGAVSVSTDAEELAAQRSRRALAAGHIIPLKDKALPFVEPINRIVVTSHGTAKYGILGALPNEAGDNVAVYKVRHIDEKSTDLTSGMNPNDDVDAASAHSLERNILVLFLIVVAVCLGIGYYVGRRWKRWNRYWRSVRSGNGAPQNPYMSFDEVDAMLLPDASQQNEGDTRDATKMLRKRTPTTRRKRTRTTKTVEKEETEQCVDNIDALLDDEDIFVASTESTGSRSSGGVVSSRNEQGWLTVGSLEVSQKLLGTGSHGTLVYEGRMTHGGRKVAVKRLLRQFFDSAKKEISLLVQLDEASPYVVRYHAMEEDSEFIYLALELCDCNLAERVLKKMTPALPTKYIKGPIPMCTLRALRQLLQGLAGLHRVGVVHRDLKPQNVLISRVHSTRVGDVKLADVGLATQLVGDRSSYTAVANNDGGVGTTGWRAPEVLRSDRQTKAVDMFSAGCVVFFVLTGGKHAFGEHSAVRDGNILQDNKDLTALEALELPEAVDIVRKMMHPVYTERPTAEAALLHPFFWTDATKLSFLVDISDRLYDLRNDPNRYTERFDRSELAVKHCSDWRVFLDMNLISELGRGYENTASGILRVIRNKRNHYSELSPELQRLLGPLPEDDSSSEQDEDHASNFLTYFTSKVPHLLMTTYQFALTNDALTEQPHFTRYGIPAAMRCEEEPANTPPLHPMVARRQRSFLQASDPNRHGSTRVCYSVEDMKAMYVPRQAAGFNRERLVSNYLFDDDAGRRHRQWCTTGVREPSPAALVAAYEEEEEEEDEPVLAQAPPPGFERPPRFINSASPSLRPRRGPTRFTSPAARPRGPNGDGFAAREREREREVASPVFPREHAVPPEPLALQDPIYPIASVTKRRERMLRAKEMQAQERRAAERDWSDVRRQ